MQLTGKPGRPLPEKVLFTKLFTKVDSHKYSGEWGLVMVSDEAMDVENISMPLRCERL